jgi:hypothetical protein
VTSDKSVAAVATSPINPVLTTVGDFEPIALDDGACSLGGNAGAVETSVDVGFFISILLEKVFVGAS